jgi:hypothetical protein
MSHNSLVGKVIGCSLQFPLLCVEFFPSAVLFIMTLEPIKPPHLYQGIVQLRVKQLEYEADQSVIFH